MNNWDYPIGADNENAPWNEEEPVLEYKEVTCSQTLSKSCTICGTDNDSIYDVFKEQKLTPMQLIERYKVLLEKVLNNKPLDYTEEHLKDEIEECKGWVEDEFEAVEE